MILNVKMRLGEGVCSNKRRHRLLIPLPLITLALFIFFFLPPLFLAAAVAHAGDSGAEQMVIQLLGTSAADPGGWVSYGRQLSSILVNNNLLVDFSCWPKLMGIRARAAWRDCASTELISMRYTD